MTADLSVGALRLRRVSKGHAGEADACLEDGCNRKGRYSVMISGYLVDADSPLAVSPYGLLCKPCAESWSSLWESLSGHKHWELTVQAVGNLAGSVPERVDAVDALNQLGYPREAIVQAVKATAERRSLEEVLEVLDRAGTGA